MEYTFGDFKVEDYIACKEVIEKNKEEVSPLGWDVKVDLPTYINGNFKTATIKKDGEMVGYAVFLLVNHQQHSDKLLAVQDVVYIHPDYRIGFTGVKFIKKIESSLKELSVDGIIQSSTSKKDLSSLFEYLGYEQTEVLYFKEL